MRNIIFDPAIVSQLGLKDSDSSISKDLQRICQLVSIMILTETEGNLSKSPHTVVGLPETRRALEGGCFD